MTKAYIDNLRAASDAANLHREEAKAERRHPDSRVSADWKPVVTQLEILFSNYTPAMLSRPLIISELVPLLSGRFHTFPHAMHVGQALRALGWTQRRDWTREGGGRRYWYRKEGTAPAHTP